MLVQRTPDHSSDVLATLTRLKRIRSYSSSITNINSLKPWASLIRQDLTCNPNEHRINVSKKYGPGSAGRQKIRTRRPNSGTMLQSKAIRTCSWAFNTTPCRTHLAQRDFSSDSQRCLGNGCRRKQAQPKGKRSLEAMPPAIRGTKGQFVPGRTCQSFAYTLHPARCVF